MCGPSLLTKFNPFIAQVVMFGPVASTQIRLMNPNPSIHGDMGWGWASLGCYPKVTAMSYQLIIGENNQFLLVLLQFSSLEMSMVVENQLDSSMEI